MIFDKEKLQELNKENDVKTTADLQDLQRGITKEVIEVIYDGKITDHLGYKKYEQKAGDAENTCNGHSTKKVKSKIGKIALEIPCDRKGKFEPQIIRKYQKDISGIEEKVISMYAKGMSIRDIQAHIYDIYGYEISPEAVSNITDSVIEKAREWQVRPLQAVYPIVFMDGLVVKMRNEGYVRKMTVYAVIGIDLEGNKDCLGLYVADTESAKYWLMVMNELKTQGVEEILIFSVDNLSGISEAIESIFPKAYI